MPLLGCVCDHAASPRISMKAKCLASGKKSRVINLLSGYVCGQPRMSVKADLSTTLYCLASGKKSMR